MEISESQYKFNLALDMIYYLTKIVLYNHPNKAELVSHLIDKWDVRINQNLSRIRNDQAKKLSKKEDIPIDVASVIISAHQAEINVLKGEFKDAVKKIIINTMAQEAIKK